MGALSQFMSNSTQEHWFCSKTYFSIYERNVKLCLQFVSTKTKNITLYGYADADWISDFSMGKSTSGYVLYQTIDRSYRGVRNVNL